GGHDAILRMLNAFRQGKAQADGFQDVLGVSEQSFFTEFMAWAEKQVSTWGYDEASAKKCDELKTKGEGLITARQYKEAVAVWEEIVKLRPMDQQPHMRLAFLYLTKEAFNYQKARDHLIRLHEVSLKDDRFAKRVARLASENNDLPMAEKYAMESVYVDPYDLDAHELLLSIASKTGNKPAAEREE